MTKPPTFRLIVEDGAIEALASIKEAKDGNLVPLAERIRAGAELRDDERAFAADALEGKISRPKHRPPRATTVAKRRRIAEFVHIYKHYFDCKQDAAVRQAEIAFNVSTRQVYRALNELDADPHWGPLIDPLFAGFARILKSGARPGEGPIIDVPLAPPGPIYPSDDRN